MSLSFIIKVTNSCNLQCSYCYENRGEPPQKMDIDFVKVLLSQINDYFPLGGKVSFTWHGGEPLLLGKKFYEDVVCLQKQFTGINFQNKIQTNALLLNNEFINFFLNNNFGVGISYDGPKELNLFHQSTQSSIDKQKNRIILDNIMNFKDIKERKGDGKVGILAVCTKETIKRETSFFDFFKDNNLNLMLNPIFGYGTKYMDLLVDPEEYGSFLCRLYDKWICLEKFTFSIEPFKSIISSMLTGHPKFCQFSGSCGFNHFAIDATGDVYICGRWSKSQTLLGNMFEANIKEILCSKQLIDFQNIMYNRIQSCLGCRYFSICHGGCSYLGYFGSGNFEKDYFCRSYYMLFDHIRFSLERRKKC